MSILANDQVAFYKGNGYLLLDGYISADRCRRLAVEADTIAEGRHANLLDIHSRSQAFRELMLDAGVLALADQIQGAKMIPIGSIFFFCKPGNPLEQGSVWHQDNYAVKAPYGSYLIVSVAIDEASEENGSLEVFPGTHLLGDLPNTPSKNFEFDEHGRVVRAYPIGNAVSIPIGYKPISLRYPRGSLILIHGHLVHGAPKNPSKESWRRAIYMHYIKDGDPFWPGWNARRQLVERPDYVSVPAQA